jgi:hypothetical protein
MGRDGMGQFVMGGVVFWIVVLVYRRESNMATSSSPVKNNNVQFLLGVLLPCETLNNF